MSLATATGADSGAQNAIGTGVAGCTLADMRIGIYFVPLFFTLISGGWKTLAAPQPA